MTECLVYGDVNFPVYEQAAAIAQPRAGALDFPPSPLAPQLATVLPWGFHPMAAMGADQLHAPLRQSLPPWVRVPGLVVARTRRLLARPTGAVARDGNGVPGRLRQGHVRRGRRVQGGSHRHTLAVDHHHPLRTCATCGLSDAGPLVSPGQSCRQHRLPPRRVGRGRPVGPGIGATPSAIRLGLPSPGGAASRDWGTETAPASRAIGRRSAGPRGGLRRRADAGGVAGRRLARP